MSYDVNVKVCTMYKVIQQNIHCVNKTQTQHIINISY